MNRSPRRSCRCLICSCPFAALPAAQRAFRDREAPPPWLADGGQVSAALLQGCSADPFGLRFLQHDRKLPVQAHLLLAQLNPGLFVRTPLASASTFENHASASLDFAHPLQIAQSPSAASRRNLLPQPFLVNRATSDCRRVPCNLCSRSIWHQTQCPETEPLRRILVSLKSRGAAEAPSPRPLNFNARIALLAPSKGILTGHL